MKQEDGLSPIQYQDRKRKAIEQLLPRVKSVALNLMTTLPRNVELNDLVQEGVIALLQSFDRYDPTKGATFFTFSMKRVKGAMYDYLRKIDWLPRTTRQQVKTVERAMVELEGELGKTPSISEISDRSGMTVEEVETTFNEISRGQILHLDEHTNMDEEEFIDFIPSKEDSPDEHLVRSELKTALYEEIRSLSEREQLILSLYYVEELTFKEIGSILGVSESRISQLHTIIIAKLRQKLS